jgi:hypothetical protein
MGRTYLDAPMKYRSQKRESEYRERRPLVARLLAERPWCEACPVFAAHDGKVTYARQPSVDIHEVLTRGRGGSILDEPNLLAVCRSCHRRIGNYPLLANELGLTRSSWDAGL